MTRFTDLPESIDVRYRWAGSGLVDEEQFRIEGWHEYRGEWRPTIQGLRAYAELRRQRREAKRAAWNRDDEWTEEVNRQLDGAA